MLRFLSGDDVSPAAPVKTREAMAASSAAVEVSIPYAVEVVKHLKQEFPEHTGVFMFCMWPGCFNDHLEGVPLCAMHELVYRANQL